MFYQNTGVKSYRNCEGPEGHSDESELTGWCRTKSFRISLLSSNNPDYFTTRKGFVVCENHSGYHLMPAYVSLQFNYRPIYETRDTFLFPVKQEFKKIGHGDGSVMRATETWRQNG